MEQSKPLLVHIGDNSREVVVSSDEEEVLKHATRVAFKDVLPKDVEFFFQIKDLDWGGEYVDLQPPHPIPERSVLKVVKLQKQVCIHLLSVFVHMYRQVLNSL